MPWTDLYCATSTGGGRNSKARIGPIKCMWLFNLTARHCRPMTVSTRNQA